MVREREERESIFFETLLQDARRGLEESAATGNDASGAPNNSDPIDPQEEETHSPKEDSPRDGELPSEH